MNFFITMLIANVQTKSQLKIRSVVFTCTLNTLFLLSTPVFADGGHTKNNSLSLKTAIELTLARNPALKVFPIRTQALSAQLTTVRQRPSYEIAFESENFAGSDELNNVDAAEFTLSLSSVIEFGGQRNARGEVASRRQLRLHAQQEVESLDVLATVTRRYIDLLAAQQRVKLAQESLALANNSFNIVGDKASAGATPEADVKRAKAAAAQARLILSSELQQLDYLKIALASSWGARQPQFDRVLGDLYRLPKSVNFDTLFARVERNPVIQVFAAESRLKDAEIRLAKAESNTNVRWSVGVRQIETTNDTALTAGFSFPLFSGKRSAGAVAAAQAEREEVDINKETTLLLVHQQLYRLFNNRKQAALATQVLQNDIIPALKQALNETEAAYQHGRYRYVDYAIARQELLSAQRDLIDSAASALRYDADIEQLTAEAITLN